LQQVAAERRLLGAELGFVGVLHTWGRQLQHHPHVHYIVPGGGLSLDGKKWVPARQRDWLLPVAKLAAVFRARMETALEGEAPGEHAGVPAATWRARWVVHCQPGQLGRDRGAVSGAVCRTHRDQRRARRQRHGRGGDVPLHRFGHATEAGVHAGCRGVFAAVSAARAGARPTPRAPLRLAASLGHATADARRDAPTKADHRRGPAAGPAPVAPALRALHARARRHAAPAGAGAAALRGIGMTNVGQRFWPDERRRAVRVAGGSGVTLRGKPRRHSLGRRQHGVGANQTTAPRHPAHRRRASSGWAFPPAAIPRPTQSA
jgi:hypothetical protein